MSNPDDDSNSTTDGRTHPKGPNFFAIVVGTSIFLVVALIAAYFFLRLDAHHVIPHPNPTPNSLVQPLMSHSDIGIAA